MNGHQWKYKGHELTIELDEEDDNIKAFHSVVTPQGVQLHADLSPYDTSRELFEAWIDAGCPQGQLNGHNWDLEDLKKRKEMLWSRITTARAKTPNPSSTERATTSV